MTPYYHCMIASLRNIIQPICSRSSVHGDSVSLLFLPGFRYEDLQGKAAKVQASAHSEGTTVSSGLCTTSSPDSRPSNALPQHQRLCQVLSCWSVSPSSPTRPFIITFPHSSCFTICARLIPPPLMTSGSSSHSKAWKKLKRHIPLRKLPITPDMLYNCVRTWISGTLPTSPYGQLCLSASSHSSELQTYAHRLEKHFPPSLPCHFHVPGCGNYSDVDQNQTIRRHCFGSANPLYS